MFLPQEAVLQTVTVIFEDPGVHDLLVKLYQRGTLIAALSVFSLFLVFGFRSQSILDGMAHHEIIP
jgi:hypothetical protein